MELFRLSRKKYSQTLSGKGAAIRGGRWNSPGMEVIYTAANRSLAMAEVAVHLSYQDLPDDYMMMTIAVPDGKNTLEIPLKELPLDWQIFPAINATQKIGDKWLTKNKYLLLKVPSVVTQGDYNFLINPDHKDFRSVKIHSLEQFKFDRRLIR